ncbi:MAG: hypothetical protein ABSC91_05610 [Candidatus Bathyarchaeia archaeon]
MSTKEEIRKAIRDSKVLYLSLSGGEGQTVYARNQAWNLNNIIDGCGNGSHHLG